MLHHLINKFGQYFTKSSIINIHLLFNYYIENKNLVVNFFGIFFDKLFF